MNDLKGEVKDFTKAPDKMEDTLHGMKKLSNGRYEAKFERMSMKCYVCKIHAASRVCLNVFQLRKGLSAFDEEQ
ncbi:hypothetical protein V6N11_019411 [Hibiscus sabdariffa]|uniref:Uncharacterized protein n=1 Tax=Hibiscus sabdariffa TaxID=183260 RepID=A0ABR2R2B2_9ROSI